MENKRGISAFIATIMLIALVMAGAALVWQVVMPMLTPSTKLLECPKFQLEVKTVEGYTFYNDTGPNKWGVQVMVEAGSDVEPVKLKDIMIRIVDNTGNSKTFYVTNATGNALAKVSNTNALPGPSEAITYVIDKSAFTNDPDKVSIAALIKPSVTEPVTPCDATSAITIPKKSDIA